MNESRPAMSNPNPEQPERLRVLLGKFWTAANMLSLFRIVLVAPISYLIITDGPLVWLAGLVLLAVLTDFLDGRVARWSNTVSEWGKVLDPLADKAAAAMVTLALVIRGSLPEWFVALIVVRDGLIVLGSIVLAKRTSQVMMSIWWGKVAVTVLAITVLAALLQADPPILAFCVWATTALLLFSFVLYVLRFIRMFRYYSPKHVNQDRAHAAVSTGQ
jgi:cardiolipin synthase (CMP-forming)